MADYSETPIVWEWKISADSIYLNTSLLKTNGKMQFGTTTTAVWSTGNKTINQPTGTVNIAASWTTVTVTNSYVTATSIVFAVVRTADDTAVIKNVVPSEGSFIINIVATTAEVSIGFVVIN